MFVVKAFPGAGEGRWGPTIYCTPGPVWRQAEAYPECACRDSDERFWVCFDDVDGKPQSVCVGDGQDYFERVIVDLEGIRIEGWSLHGQVVDAVGRKLEAATG